MIYFVSLSVLIYTKLSDAILFNFQCTFKSLSTLDTLESLVKLNSIHFEEILFIFLQEQDTPFRTILRFINYFIRVPISSSFSFIVYLVVEPPLDILDGLSLLYSHLLQVDLPRLGTLAHIGLAMVADLRFLMSSPLPPIILSTPLVVAISYSSTSQSVSHLL